MTPEVFKYIVDTATQTERRRWEDAEKERTKNVCVPHYLSVKRSARSLAEPAKKCAVHHREREKQWCEKLSDAEKELREKGISVEVYDPYVGGFSAAISSGAVASGMVGNNAISTNWLNTTTGGALVSNQFQPRIDHQLLDVVKAARAKMIEHRNAAEQYEKYARAFAVAGSEQLIELNLDMITYFRLEE